MLAVEGAQWISRGPGTPIPVSDAVALGILAALELVAIALVVRMWRERAGSAAGRVLWTAVALVPLLGLLAFVVWRDPPPPNDPTDRGRDVPPERFG